MVSGVSGVNTCTALVVDAFPLQLPTDVIKMGWTLSSHTKRISSLIFFLCLSVRSENTTCITRCQLQDKDSSCWIKARKYFLQELISAINNYASVEIMINKWQTHQGKEVEEILNSTLAASNIGKENEKGPLPISDLVAIIDVINNKTKKIVELTDSSSLSISCPTPCDYINNLWIYLFICSCVVVLLTIPIVATHLYFSRQNNIKYQLSS